MWKEWDTELDRRQRLTELQLSFSYCGGLVVLNFLVVTSSALRPIHLPHPEHRQGSVPTSLSRGRKPVSEQSEGRKLHGTGRNMVAV